MPRPSQPLQRSDLIAAAVVVAGLGWRLWLSHATYFSSDEAWHYSLANRDSVGFAYQASLTISHPPLLILILYFWRVLGTSDLMLRLPSVIAGAAFCWVFYRWLDFVAGRAAAWAGLILATFLGPMITMSAEVRQYPFLLLFSAGAAYLLELALSDDSAGLMLASAASLYVAMLSHYSAFFVAGALGIYVIVRIVANRPSSGALAAWCAGQAVGVAIAAWLYKTHLGRLSSLLNQALLPQQYLSWQYFHPGKDHLPFYLYRGTLGVFRFEFGQTQIGQLAAVLFLVGVVILLAGKPASETLVNARAVGSLLLLPFVLNWAAAAAGLYPYGRMRQCLFLAMFALAGVSVCLARIVKQRPVASAALALGIVVLCHAFGTLQDRDELPVAEQRHEQMDDALRFVRTHVTPADVILTDQSTSFQLQRYLCAQKPAEDDGADDGLQKLRCEGIQIASTGPADGALTAASVAARWNESQSPLRSAAVVWVVQGAWASGLGEALRGQSPEFSPIEVHSFGRFLEVFSLPPRMLSTEIKIPTCRKVRDKGGARAGIRIGVHA